MKKNPIILCALAVTLGAQAEKKEITAFHHAGPYAVQMPYMMDSVSASQKKFAPEVMLDYGSTLPLQGSISGTVVNGTPVPGASNGYAINELCFTVSNTAYTKATLTVEGLAHQKTFVDGEAADKELTLEPGTHTVIIRYLSEAGKQENANVSIETEKDGVLTLQDDGTRSYTIRDVLQAKKYGFGTSVSPDGKYAIVNVVKTEEGGNTVTEGTVRDIATGRIIGSGDGLHWMPRSSKYFSEEVFNDKKTLTLTDPATGKHSTLATGLPKDCDVMVAPTEDYLILTMIDEGPQEDPNVYQIIHPDDRQPGWRDRSTIYRYDLKNGMMQQIVYGYHNINVADISQDGRYLLLQKSESRLTQRPTTLFSLLRLNVETLHCDTIVSKDGFINNCIFSPDGKTILVSGSPESFDGIGKNVKEGQTPSMIDNQLYFVDVQTKKVVALTRDFNPSVGRMHWSKADGMVYFTAEDKDCVNLFMLNPKTNAIKRMDNKEEIVSNFSLASTTPTLLYYGESASNSFRMYAMNTKSGKSTLIDDLSKDNLKDIKLGKCEAWSFKSSRGDSILCRYYLPPTFDATKKYPMIVNYYGGCSPTSRDFESRYPQHAYAALGYVVLIVEPSGATGFGQEFSARHVNTAGEGPAEDIIEATKNFCQEHSFVNEKKIGCIGASYGGFMTQYLQTKTDIFAAAISHAGISDHTSYWGEGYWGYSYSEVSMANSYPWSQPDLYTKQSPLFNADKVHTPLLFVHGDADHNVPIGESIQMYNALKLLGRETAFVAVSNQDHHILEYNKRLKWQNTIWAWFAKYLQDDPTWWNAMYPEKQL